MFKAISQIFKKNKEAILYLIFGGFTTLINIVSYSLLYYVAGFSNTISNIFAWIASVIFAYLTNKLFVFENKSFALPKLFVEVFSFFSCRLLTGILDIGIMFLFVDVLLMNALLIKVISNVVVIILNYVASKFLIFKRRKPQ